MRSISAFLAAAVSVVAASTPSVPAAGINPDQRDPTYLKRVGRDWFRVRRGPARLEILGRAPAPRVGAPLDGGAPAIFDPWVAYPTGSWPEAVAIGDVNADGLNDVALVTSFYFSARRGSACCGPPAATTRRAGRT